MNILGISCYYHDSAACLISEGEIAASAQEERFNRQKNSPRFPVRAVDYCLKSRDLTVYDIDYVVFYEKPFLKFSRVVLDHIRNYPFTLGRFMKTMPVWLKNRLSMPMVLKNEIGYEGEILFIRHHLSHAAASFLASPYEEAALLSADGVGERATVALGKGTGRKIHLMEEIRYPDSLGLVYSAVTTYLGFRALRGEGKVMGLAGYGMPEYLDKFREIIRVRSDGSFSIDDSYFGFSRGKRMYSKKFVKVFGPPPGS